ncbi:hypothetical protein NliqN6_2446 [Naganishia liquefaciens]|uniref:E3 ubiquitin protein ligase n=1 Tax=Naganishia liquefaciens TaxID=104408 RepID=A0A8H3TTQ6_9TREE|nr:hypothetical protein NliqN6_2446 [Naganishia liquefaciens]
MESGSTSPRGRKRDRLGNEKGGTTQSPTPGSARRRPAALADDPDKEPRFVGDPDFLEDFRKTQIYLQLLAYRREAQRATSLLDQQTEKLQVVEGNAHALAGMWAEVEKCARYQASEPNSDDAPVLDEIKEAAIYTPHLEAALAGHFHSLKSVIGTIQPPSTAATATLQAQLAALRTAHTALKAEYEDLQKRHDSAVEASEKSARYSDELKLELARAGGRVDPIKAESPGTVQLPASQLSVGNGNESPAQRDDKSEVKQDPGAMQVDGVSANGTAEGVAGRPTTNGASTPQEGPADAKYLLDHQSREIASLRAECLQLRKDKDEISAWVIAPTDEIIAQTPLYKALVEKFAENMVGYKTRSVRGEEAIEAANAMRDDMERFRESTLHEHRLALESIRAQLRGKESEVARLRGQRDVLREENDMRKAQQAVSNKASQEIEEFVQFQEERVKMLVAEAKRLHAQLAAIGGEKDYLGFLLQREGSDLDYVRSLEEQLRQAKDSRKLLEEQLANFTASSPDLESLRQELTIAREEAATSRRRLEEREALCVTGPDASRIQDSEATAKQIQSLKLQVEQANTAVNSLYQEIDQLTQAYEGMQRIAQTKVYNLKALETQVVDLSTVKAKAEHKFFAVSRENLGLKELEVALKKSIDLQRAALEKARAVEDGLHAQLSNQEKELTLMRTTVYKYEAELQSLQTELSRAKAEVKAEEVRMTTYKADAAKYMDAESKASAQCHELEEQILQLRAKLKEAKNLAKTVESKAPATVSDSGLKRERDQLMGLLRCPACSIRFKNKILRTCLHTFCEECIQSRLANRSRKCITCMTPFGQDDVKNLF